MVEGESVAMLPDVAMDLGHARAIPEFLGKIRDIGGEHADVERPGQRLCGHRRSGVVGHDHGQSRGRVCCHPRREVQVVPGGPADLPAVAALQEVEPSRVVLRELGDPAPLIDIGAQVEMIGASGIARSIQSIHCP